MRQSGSFLNANQHFHLDRHTDTLTSKLDSWIQQCDELESMDIETYLSFLDKDSPDVELFRWDNYGSIFLHVYKEQVSRCIFATHGDEPNHENVMTVMPWLIPDNVDFWMEKGRWICNVDLDYFFCDLEDGLTLMVSEQYVVEIFTKIKRLLDQNKITVLTICFSPEWCGSWKNSEDAWEIIQSCLKTSMKLP
jgi:hypothetical protein